ncbi:MAG: leucyl aminopeptidase [Gammaproteobacteria bacterium]|nr:MAG: leucyl aminopeptidase [Gammaproteobacteria bacterium]
MHYSVSDKPINKDDSDCLVIPYAQPAELKPIAQRLPAETLSWLADVLEQEHARGDKSRTLLLHRVPGVEQRIILAGVKKTALNDRAYLKLLNDVMSVLGETNARTATFYLTHVDVKKRDTSWKIRQAILAAEESAYRYDETKSKKDHDKVPLEAISFHLAGTESKDRCELAIKQGCSIAEGITLTKDLANLPGNICTPRHLAKQAEKLAAHEKITTTILDEEDMAELSMGALLAVSRGSREPARLIVMEYKGGKEDEAPIALVGKGLTFDAGGISLKPGASMDEMKYDMCGGASVLGVMQTLAQLELPVNVVGVVPSSENLPDGDALKPGDIVTSMSGQTIEVLNTDAEGRLILCDALTYTERFKPARVIDIATLTGACIIALGHHLSGVLGSHQKLVDALIKAGEFSRDGVWQLPLADEYDEQLKSNFADMANIGGRPAGTITAACFLARFTRKFKWAHLDIAGTAWKSGKAKGATGRPVHLLAQFLIDYANAG